MAGLRDKMKNKYAKKSQSRAVYSSDPVGSVGLWYGAGGKVAFSGKLTFGDYKDDDCVNFFLLLFEPEERKKYIYNGIVTLYSDKKTRERQPKVGKLYVYESQKQAAYMMIYMDTDVEGESEVFTCPLIESDNSNPRSAALFGRVYEADNEQRQSNDKSRVKKAEQVLQSNRKKKSDDWYTDLEPKDLITIIKSYDEDKLGIFVSLVGKYLSSTTSIVDEQQKVDHELIDEPEYEIVDESEDDDNEEYEEDVADEIEDDEEEVEEMPHESSKQKLRISDIAKKRSGKPSKSLINRVSTEFFTGLDSSDIEDIV